LVPVLILGACTVHIEVQELYNTIEQIFYNRNRSSSSRTFEVPVLSSGELLPKSNTVTWFLKSLMQDDGLYYNVSHGLRYCYILYKILHSVFSLFLTVKPILLSTWMQNGHISQSHYSTCYMVYLTRSLCNKRI
jgi:hypothetical protein